ncbi:GNAT family N-acetyltransferase [Nocardia stercoris]|uniref:GNAT family N-acetyltransferase n=1 Tax=Nocardia stercoris TaxID=2483361 RepID=UPI00131A066B|nr:GNAT family N-acetyltransferase [Nocardia stercoris]
MSGVLRALGSGAQPEPAEPELRSAGESHLAGIVELAGRWQTSAPGRAAGKEGFLVSGYGIDTYRALLSRAEHFLVAVLDGQVIGFLVAYTDAEIQPEETLNVQIAAELGSVLVIKQVCVDPRFARRGLARRMYSTVLSANPDLPVVAAVVSDPVNVPSARLHHAMGFVPYRTVTAPDGIERTIWLNRKPSTTVLLKQYGYAVDLYKHEDTLNWSKLNNFFYISVALFTAYGVLQNTSGSRPHLHAFLLGISGLGLLTSIGFTLTLIAGTHYLGARKHVVGALEDRLVEAGGIRVVTASPVGTDQAWLKRSPTRFVLRGIPILVGFAWLAVGIAGLL